MTNVTEQNERRKAELIRELSKRAVPGNAAWRKIEYLQGYEGDYSPADHGEAPKGAKW